MVAWLAGRGREGNAVGKASSNGVPHKARRKGWGRVRRQGQGAFLQRVPEISVVAREARTGKGRQRNLNGYRHTQEQIRVEAGRLEEGAGERHKGHNHHAR